MKTFVYRKPALFFILLTAGILYVGGPVWAQKSFSGYEEQESFYNTVYSTLHEVYKNGLAALPAKNKKDLERIYNQRWSYITRKIDNKEIYGNPGAQNYLKEILETIIRANPELGTKIFIVIFRVPVFPTLPIWARD